jgi:S1-C subfamily serine protease
VSVSRGLWLINPHADILASSGNFTQGNVTALAGMGDDSRYLQISTPVQAGNSGGPLLDQSGNLVGVVTSKLNALKMAQASGDLPQNVNFALKASIVASFLDINGIKYTPGSETSAFKPEELADQAKSMSVFVLCK